MQTTFIIPYIRNDFIKMLIDCLINMYCSLLRPFFFSHMSIKVLKLAFGQPPPPRKTRKKQFCTSGLKHKLKNICCGLSPNFPESSSQTSIRMKLFRLTKMTKAERMRNKGIGWKLILMGSSHLSPLSPSHMRLLKVSMWWRKDHSWVMNADF